MDFILSIFNRTKTKSQDKEDDEGYLLSLEEQILKSLNMKRESTESLHQTGLMKGTRNKHPQTEQQSLQQESTDSILNSHKSSGVSLQTEKV